MEWSGVEEPTLQSNPTSLPEKEKYELLAMSSVGWGVKTIHTICNSHFTLVLFYYY